MDPGYQDYILGHTQPEPQPWIPPSCSSSSVLPQLNDCSSDDFRFLPEMPLQPSISAEAEMLCDFSKEYVCRERRIIHDMVDWEETQSEGMVLGYSGLREQQADQLKRTRSAEVHTISERRRRDRIKVKVRALQELMPHCKKKDRASIREDAAEYIKSLKFQVETMMKLGGSECVVPCRSCRGKSTIHSPRLSTFMPIRPGIQMGIGMPFGAGVLGMGCSAQYAPVFQVPSPGLALSPSAVAGFPFPSIPAGNCSEACRAFQATPSGSSKQATISSGNQNISTTAIAPNFGVGAGGLLPVKKGARTSRVKSEAVSTHRSDTIDPVS